MSGFEVKYLRIYFLSVKSSHHTSFNSLCRLIVNSSNSIITDLYYKSTLRNAKFPTFNLNTNTFHKQVDLLCIKRISTYKIFKLQSQHALISFALYNRKNR